MNDYDYVQNKGQSEWYLLLEICVDICHPQELNPSPQPEMVTLIPLSLLNSKLASFFDNPIL